MAQHTPGPWHVEMECHRAPSDWMEAAVHVGSPWDGSLRTLARIPQAEHAYNDAETAEVQANARLIAAAPELLAALESIAEDCDRYGRMAEGAWSSAAIALQSCAQDARAVIRKARGES